MVKLVSVNLGIFPKWLHRRDIDINIAMDEVSRLLKQTEADVICLQELWTGQKRMIKNLKDVYPYSYVDQRWGRYLFGLASGLAIFSKRPILKKVITDYRVVRGDERFARKGIMGVKIQDVGFIFNTHGQAGDGAIKEYLDKISKRLSACVLNLNTPASVIDPLHWEQGQELINKFVDESNQMILYAGDFNIGSTTSKYQPMLATLHARDTYDVTRGDFNRIDYILDVRNSCTGECHMEQVIPYPYSDHVTVLGEFKGAEPL